MGAVMSGLKTYWERLSFDAFNAKVPKFTWSGKFDPETKQMPTVNVSWRWLAQGGILNRATLIGAGEAGREAFLPLDRNTGWMDDIAERVGSSMSAENIAAAVYQAVVDGMHESEISVNTTVNLDGRTLYRGVQKAEKATSYRMSSSEFV